MNVKGKFPYETEQQEYKRMAEREEHCENIFAKHRLIHYLLKTIRNSQCIKELVKDITVDNTIIVIDLRDSKRIREIRSHQEVFQSFSRWWRSLPETDNNPFSSTLSIQFIGEDDGCETYSIKTLVEPYFTKMTR